MSNGLSGPRSAIGIVCSPGSSQSAFISRDRSQDIPLDSLLVINTTGSQGEFQQILQSTCTQMETGDQGFRMSRICQPSEDQVSHGNQTANSEHLPQRMNQLRIDSPQIDSSLATSSLQNHVYVDNTSGNTVMNILPSMSQQRMANSDIPVAMAEQQLSFRTYYSPMYSGPHAMTTMSCHVSTSAAGPICTPGLLAGQLYTSRNAPFHPGVPATYASSSGEISNSMNMTASSTYPIPAAGQNSTPNLPPYQPTPMQTARLCTPGNGAQSYHSSRGSNRSSMCSFIDTDVHVRKLPLKFVRFLASHLECRDSQGWRELLDMYGWNYENIRLFGQRQHQEGPFFSLLQEDGFQQYTVGQLLNDLDCIPRRDVLEEFKRMIEEHNVNINTSMNAL